MSKPESETSAFAAKFLTREQVYRYRDRFTTGRRGPVDRAERATLRALLAGIERLEVAMDLPSGTGRLSPILAEHADRVILADASPVMLQVAREDLPDLPAEYLETDIENIRLPDRSVDLVFCHRLLHHVHNRGLRARLFSELARVTRRYLAVSYYSPGLRTRWRFFRRHLLGKAGDDDRPASVERFIEEVSNTGLRLARRETLRRFPLPAVFFLFERVPGADEVATAPAAKSA